MDTDTDECTISVTLVCMVPVYVVIEDNEISKVVVDDEALDLSKATLADRYQGDAKALLKEAIHVAEVSDYWPSWEFGW